MILCRDRPGNKKSKSSETIIRKKFLPWPACCSVDANKMVQSLSWRSSILRETNCDSCCISPASSCDVAYCLMTYIRYYVELERWDTPFADSLLHRWLDSFQIYPTKAWRRESRAIWQPKDDLKLLKEKLIICGGDFEVIHLPRDAAKCKGVAPSPSLRFGSTFWSSTCNW